LLFSFVSSTVFKLADQAARRHDPAALPFPKLQALLPVDPRWRI
jgi:hypothetical protein